MTVEKPKPKQLLRPMTTGADSAMNQSQFLAITCNSLKAREKSRVQGAIGFGFASHWLKNWLETFEPITKHSNRNHAITFDSHLKLALHKKCSLFQTEMCIMQYENHCYVLQNIPLSIWVILLHLMLSFQIQISKIKTFLMDSQPEQCS